MKFAVMRLALAPMLATSFIFTVPARAADVFPNRPIRVVVPSAPGGLLDVVTRLAAQKMSEKLGQPVVVENRAGGGTLVGTRFVRSAPADGYTLLAATNTITALPAVKLDPGYDLLKDFTGIGQIGRSPWFVLVGANQSDKSIADFIARGKSNPATMTFASAGFGTTPYLAAQSFLHRAGVKMLHIPYKGNSAVYPDLISGRVTMLFDGVGNTATMVKGGQLRALGVTSHKRLAAYPDIPTVAEQGLPDFTSYFYLALLAPAGTPKAVVQRLADALQSATSTKEMRQRFEADGIEPIATTPEEFNKALRRDLDDMAQLATTLGVKKE
ncbi:tripartite tricarboxylate transporter substrate binding protein [Cupriavidus basilensis]|uniref:Tripartite tricarboxylate transporter substrate binding protein n=1 Tax=Cupriavidus basilensis TaxID=68895 RepID=A0ABT6AWF9_9BURK|nr:tripartite tricarboxylate transporter substrate binding protein [Cupriavidus basilensis]MDF3836698.1 tripartite tricarboxylate transporter substrate binding protein [Cupriavidus basilensis]